MQIGHILCGLIGHSEFTDARLGYIYCARCTTLLGDNIVGARHDGVCITRGHSDHCKKCAELRGAWGLKQRLLAWIEEPILRRRLRS